MRKVALEQIHLLAKKDPNIFFIGSDLGVGTLDNYKKEFPDRVLMEGICEANIVGISAGLALEGKVVFVNTIANFLVRRAYEQICIDLCLHNLPVRLVGNGGGMVYAPLGPTHMATDDFALMRVLPNMTILAPADAVEMSQLMQQTIGCPGPIYIRVAKGGDPVVTDSLEPAIIGKARYVRPGSDILIVTTGVMLQFALEAVDQLESFNVSAGVLHFPTLKPFDKYTFLQASERCKAIITMEEHSIIGGLGGVVSEILAENCFEKPKAFKRLGLPDVFPDDYGSQDHLLERYQLTTENLVRQSINLLKLD